MKLLILTLLTFSATYGHCFMSEKTGKYEVTFQSEPTQKDIDYVGKQFDYIYKLKHSPESIDRIRGILLDDLISGGTVTIAVIVTLFYTSDVPEDFIKDTTKMVEDTTTQHIQQFLLTNFSDYKRFSLVERTDIDRILKEHNLSYSGIIEQGSIQSGKILGVNYFYFVDDYAAGYEPQNPVITGKLVNAETGSILTTWKGDDGVNTLTQTSKK